MHLFDRWLADIFSWKVLLVVVSLVMVALLPNLPSIDPLANFLQSFGQLFNSAAPAVTPAANYPSWLPMEMGQPWWHYWDQRLVIALMATFWLLLVPRLSQTVTVLICCLLLVGFVGLHIGLQLSAKYWLAAEYLLAHTLLGLMVMTIWRAQYQRWCWLQEKCHFAQCELARAWLQQDRIDDVRDLLADCATDDESLQLIYQLGLKQESKRQYEQALETYHDVLRRCRNYKDVKDKVAQLQGMQGHTTMIGGDGDLTKTIAISAPSVSMPVLGRYQIERELGRGAVGIVYLGTDPKISRRVAIKTMNYSQYEAHMLADLKERFYREAEAAGRLNHPNIVTVYDIGEEDDLAYIAMDYVEGEPLNRYCSPANLLPVESVYHIVAEVADALDYAHQQQIVHRDIKPGNIIYNTETDKLKVTDFGIARLVDDSNTKTGDILGSPIYLSPELLRGHKATGATDIYSLGVSFYQLLTGQPPFSGDSIANVTYQIVNAKFKSVRSIRPELPSSAVRIINKAMHKEPAKRYESGAEMAEAVRKSMQRDFKRSA